MYDEVKWVCLSDENIKISFNSVGLFLRIYGLGKFNFSNLIREPRIVTIGVLKGHTLITGCIKNNPCSLYCDLKENIHSSIFYLIWRSLNLLSLQFLQDT